MDNKLIVSSSPHIGAKTKTRNIMLDVIIALIPALIASVVMFGPRTIVVICATVAASVLAEYVCRKVMKRNNTVGDLSAIVTGLLLAFNLPSGIPIWMAVLGGVIAIVVAKADVWRTWPELCKPGAGCPYHPYGVLPNCYDHLAGTHVMGCRCSDHSHTVGVDCRRHDGFTSKLP